MVVSIWTMEVDKRLTLCTWCIFPDPFGSRFINSQTRRIPSCHSPGMLHGSFRVFHFRLVKNSVLRWTCRLSNCAADLRSNDLAMLQSFRIQRESSVDVTVRLSILIVPRERANRYYQITCKCVCKQELTSVDVTVRLREGGLVCTRLYRESHMT